MHCEASREVGVDVDVESESERERERHIYVFSFERKKNIENFHVSMTRRTRKRRRHITFRAARGFDKSNRAVQSVRERSYATAMTAFTTQKGHDVTFGG